MFAAASCCGSDRRGGRGGGGGSLWCCILLRCQRPHPTVLCAVLYCTHLSVAPQGAQGCSSSGSLQKAGCLAGHSSPSQPPMVYRQGECARRLQAQGHAGGSRRSQDQNGRALGLHQTLLCPSLPCSSPVPLAGSLLLIPPSPQLLWIASVLCQGFKDISHALPASPPPHSRAL